MLSASQRLYRKVADELAAAIRGGAWRTGQKLPSERDLAERYGVSRPSIREAMIALEIYGLVEIRQGSGIYVVEPRAGTRGAEMEDLDVGAFELLEARIIIEGGAAAVAATAASEADIARLAGLLDAMERSAAAQSEALDREFHLELARLTRNGPLLDAIETLWDLRTKSKLARMIERRAHGGGRLQRDEEHRAILDALTRRDPAGARAAMQSHLEKVRDFLLESTETEEIQKLRDQQRQAREALTRRSVY